MSRNHEVFSNNFRRTFPSLPPSPICSKIEFKYLGLYSRHSVKSGFFIWFIYVLTVPGDWFVSIVRTAQNIDKRSSCVSGPLHVIRIRIPYPAFLYRSDQLYVAVLFWHFVKPDLFSVRYCTVAYYTVTFYKVPEQYSHIYLHRANAMLISYRVNRWRVPKSSK